jgi:4,5-dihydroxyphthalate decarboxylase
MPKLRLSFISGYNERVEPLMNGSVEIEGLELIPTYSDPSETFWRQLNFQEFPISEMSLSSYLIARSRGIDMMAVPVFPSRRFMHMEHSVHIDSGIERPEDLVGKRIGVGEYQQTAALWFRGTMEHDFGVSQFKVDWYMERTEELSHGGATGFKPMDGISFHRIPPDKSLASMLVSHELDAAPVSRAFRRETNFIDRSTRIRAQDADWSKVRPLFKDRVAEGARFFRDHGFIPANHTYIILGPVYREHPWLAFNLYSAFVKAKEAFYAKLPDMLPSALFFGPEYLAQTRELFGQDPFPYGVEANRPLLETLINHSHEQGLTPDKLKIEDLFAPSTLDL